MPPIPSSSKPIEKRFFSITEVAKEVGENASVLRYWEKEFRQLNPRTNARGKRFYTRRDIELIAEIRALVRDQGFTIDGARKALSSEGASVAAAGVTPSVNRHSEVLERLKALRVRVMALEVAEAKSEWLD